jgi:hypothetical protein
MWYHLIIGITGIAGMALLWAGVQALWGRTFREYMTGEVAMEGRTKCGNCGCSTACENRTNEITSIEKTD